MLNDDPYGQMRLHQTVQPQGRYSSNKKTHGLSNNLSDQKTPNGHPNTFLYRAHINLNELNDMSGNQHDQNNISSFYNDEYEESKDGQLRLNSA